MLQVAISTDYNVNVTGKNS